MDRRLPLVPIALMMAIAALAAPVQAQDPSEQHTEWREEQRDLSFRALPGEGFQATSTRSSELGDDELRANFYLEDDRLRLRYVSTERGNETVLIMDLSFLALVEFRDTNADGRYGFGDEEVQRVPIGELEEAPITSGSFLRGGTVATVSYSIPDGSNESDEDLPVGQSTPSVLPGKLDLHFYLVPTTQIFEGTEVTPLDVKFDIEITDFPYQKAGRLAFETRFTANGPVQPAAWDPRAYAIRDGYFNGFYAWESIAQVDGDERDVGVTALSYEGDAPTTGTPSDGSALNVAFAYPHGDKVVHDPQLGVVRMQGDLADLVQRLIEGDWLLYSLGLVVAIVAVGVPAAVRLRQDR